jgi:pantetheine-phosphate adenylyltransferase
MAHALFPGSFDPVTFGHVDLVERGLALFARLTIGVARNSEKRGVFAVEERVALLRDCLPEDPRLEVCSFDGLVVDYARSRGITAILRGLRTVKDFEYEYQMALTNRELAPAIQTVFLMSSHHHSFVSSTLIKEIAASGGDVTAFVPAPVLAGLRQKLDPR